LVEDPFALDHLGRERIWMNDTSVPTERLLMHHRNGEDALRVRPLFIERTVRDDGFGPPIVASKRRTLLSSRDPEERRALIAWRLGFSVVPQGAAACLAGRRPLILCGLPHSRLWA
jgi:hypothetical protein